MRRENRCLFGAVGFVCLDGICFLPVSLEDMQWYPNGTINYIEVKSILCFMMLNYKTNEFYHLEKCP